MPVGTGLHTQWRIYTLKFRTRKSPLPVQFSLLPPANEVCEGNVFTGVCLSGGGERGAWWRRCVCGERGMYSKGGACMAGGRPRAVQGRRCACRRDSHWSGWYASYWKAFLFSFSFCQNFNQNNRLPAPFLGLALPSSSNPGSTVDTCRWKMWKIEHTPEWYLGINSEVTHRSDR